MARRRRVPPKKASPQALAQAKADADAKAQAKAQGVRGPGGAARAKRTLMGCGLMMFLGLAAGAALAFVVPLQGLFADDRARAGLRGDTTRSLEKAAESADDDPSLYAVGALARTLLHIDHAGGAVERKRAEARLNTKNTATRTAPEALYARALLKRTATSPFVSGAPEDSALDDDIAKKAEKLKVYAPFLVLAQATRALDEGKRDEALALFQRAALGSDAPLRAQTELARLAVARGEFADARAVAERARTASPAHAPSRLAGVVAAVLDDLREDSPEERAIKLKKVRARLQGGKKVGPARPGEVDRDAAASDDARLLASWRAVEEEEAEAALDKMDARDAALVALLLEALAAARGDDDHAATLRARVVTVANTVPALAARQLDLSLLEGDVATAEELIGAHESALDKSEEPELALQQARLAALKLIPEDELRKRASAPNARALATSGMRFPFGELAFDVWAHGVPVVAHFDPSVFPEAAFFAALRAGAAGAALNKKLAVAVLVHKGEVALTRSDMQAATRAATEAREKAASGSSAVDPDVLFLDARIRLRQSDRDAARDAIDAAIAAAPDDPHVLLVGARLHYDNEGFIPARKALKKLDALGFKSPAALALDAMLDARSGSEKSAQASLAEASKIGADDGVILRATVLILREGKDLDAAREAADRLHAADQLRTNDPILRAWEADSVARSGGRDRAIALLNDVIAQRPNVGDAHYFLAELTGDSESYAKALQLAPGTVFALDAFKKKGAPTPPPKGMPLPRKKPR